jgi:hypothetical protein
MDSLLLIALLICALYKLIGILELMAVYVTLSRVIWLTM